MHAQEVSGGAAPRRQHDLQAIIYYASGKCIGARIGLHRVVSRADATISCGRRHVLWWAARERDEARTELAAEQATSAQLTAAVAAQNAAVDALASAKADAEARGQAALQLAAANGKRFDQALVRTRAAQATTCTEAVPAVNDVLESIR